MSGIIINHALIHVLGKDGVSVGHHFQLGHGPCGRYVTALEYELLPCGGVRVTQYSQPIPPQHAGNPLPEPDELKHFVYPAVIMTGAASFTLEN